MHSGPLVSVLIATYNRAEQLRQCLVSVLQQDYQHFEVIVVSDGSTDETPQVVASFDDSRLHFTEHQANKGYAAARNTGLMACHGEFLAFIDDDDEWMPYKLALQISVLQQLPEQVGLLYAWSKYLLPNSRSRLHVPQLRGNVFPQMLGGQCIGSIPSIVMRKSAALRIGGWDENLSRGADGTFLLAVAREYHVDFVPAVVAVIHAEHPGRLSDNNRVHLLQANRALETRLNLYSTDYAKYPEAEAKVCYTMFRNAIGAQRIRSSLATGTRLFACRIAFKSKLGYGIRMIRSVLAAVWRKYAARYGLPR